MGLDGSTQKVGTGADGVKLSYAYDQYLFHYSVQLGIIYLCMTTADYPPGSAFQFLDALGQRFVGETPLCIGCVWSLLSQSRSEALSCASVAAYGDRSRTAIAFAFNADFQHVMAAHMVRFLLPAAAAIAPFWTLICHVREPGQVQPAHHRDPC